MRPPSFDASYSGDWSRWVMEKGLPDLPGDDIGPGESVPVDYWIGPRTAAVLHVRLNGEDEESAPFAETDAELFCSVEGVWEAAGGGGCNWADERPALTPPAVDPRHVSLFMVNGGWIGDRGCKALTGEVGTSAAFVEVEQAGIVTRRPVASHAGALVVCGDWDQPLTIRVLDAEGRLLAVFEEPAGFDD